MWVRSTATGYPEPVGRQQALLIRLNLTTTSIRLLQTASSMPCSP